MIQPGRKYSATDSYRYGFNGKENDNDVKGESNSLDFGARIYDPRIGRWLSLDPLQSKYPSLSPYNFVANSPLSSVDPDGRLIIFIGGFRNQAAAHDQRFNSGNKDARPGIYKHDKQLTGYWRTDKNSFGRKSEIDKGFMKAIGDYNAWYASGSSYASSNAATRIEEGKAKAEQFHAMVQSGQITLADDETIKIVSHSHGGAHSAGFAEQLMSYKDADGKPLYNIEVMYYITPHQPEEFSHPAGVRGVQYSHPNDAVSSSNKKILGFPNSESEFSQIEGITEFDGRDIMLPMKTLRKLKPGEVVSTGLLGNRGGHNVEDNDFIFNIPAGLPGYIEPGRKKPSTTNVVGVDPVKKPGGQ